MGTTDYEKTYSIHTVDDNRTGIEYTTGNILHHVINSNIFV